MNASLRLSALLALLLSFLLLADAWGQRSRRDGDQRIPDRVREGQTAPDFSLNRMDDGEEVRLSDLRGGKPLVLIFGSLTCPPFRQQFERVNALHAKYASDAQFYWVYIREAHPEDGWVMERNRREGISVNDPRSYEERVDVAAEACGFFKTEIPCLVDEMDDRVNRAYAAWPARIFVVDATGKIALAGGPGPAGLAPSVARLERFLAGLR